MENSRTENSVRNIFFSLVNRLIAILLAFISRSIFIRCLGVEYLGVQGLFSDILTMLSLADLGFNSAMTFSMYKPLADHDTKKLAALTSFYKNIYRIIAAIITLVGIALIPLLKYLVNTENEIHHLTLYYLLYLANTIASYVVVYKTAILTADQQEYIISKYTSVFNFACTFCSCIFLVITKNFAAYLLIQVMFTYARNFYLSHLAEKKYPYITEKGTLELNEKQNILRIIGAGFVYKLTGVVLSGTDNTLISIMIGTAMVGYYSNYILVSNQIIAFAGIIFGSLTASLGNLTVQASSSHQYRVFCSIQSISMTVSAFCSICMYMLQEDFVRVWLGETFVLNPGVLIAIVLNVYFSVALYPIRIYRDAIGLYRKTTPVMVMSAIENIVLSIIFGRIIGMAGILLATSVSKITTFFWYEPILIYKNQFHKSSYTYFLGIGKNLLVIIFLIILESIISRFISVHGWVSLIVKSIIIVPFTAFGIWFFYRKSEGIAVFRKMLRLTHHRSE